MVSYPSLILFGVCVAAVWGSGWGATFAVMKSLVAVACLMINDHPQQCVKVFVWACSRRRVCPACLCTSYI